MDGGKKHGHHGGKPQHHQAEAKTSSPDPPTADPPATDLDAKSKVSTASILSAAGFGAGGAAGCDTDGAAAANETLAKAIIDAFQQVQDLLKAAAPPPPPPTQEEVERLTQVLAGRAVVAPPAAKPISTPTVSTTDTPLHHTTANMLLSHLTTRKSLLAKPHETYPSWLNDAIDNPGHYSQPADRELVLALILELVPEDQREKVALPTVTKTTRPPPAPKPEAKTSVKTARKPVVSVPVTPLDHTTANMLLLHLTTRKSLLAKPHETFPGWLNDAIEHPCHFSEPADRQHVLALILELVPEGERDEVALPSSFSAPEATPVGRETCFYCF